MIGIYQEFGSLTKWEELLGSSRIKLPYFADEPVCNSIVGKSIGDSDNQVTQPQEPMRGEEEEKYMIAANTEANIVNNKKA